jgi:hypothetical protein
MSAGSWRFTPTGRIYLLNGTFDLDTDTWKVALFSSTSNIAVASADAFSGLTGEVSAASTGYAAGGASVTIVLTGSTQIMADISTDPVWTATTDGITARYAVLYEVGGNVLVYCPLDSASGDVSITSGNTLTVACATSGIFTMS